MGLAVLSTSGTLDINNSVDSCGQYSGVDRAVSFDTDHEPGIVEQSRKIRRFRIGKRFAAGDADIFDPVGKDLRDYIFGGALDSAIAGVPCVAIGTIEIASG